MLPSSHVWEPPAIPGRFKALADLAHPRAEIDAAKALAVRVATSLTQLRSATTHQFGALEIDALADWIHTRMPRVTKLFVEVLASLISSAPNMTKSKHRNTTWDLRIASEVLGYAAVEPGSICLVIDDKRIVEAARRSGSSPPILSLSDYEMALTKGASLVTSPPPNSIE